MQRRRLAEVGQHGSHQDGVVANPARQPARRASRESLEMENVAMLVSPACARILSSVCYDAGGFEFSVPARINGADALVQRRMGGHRAEERFAQAVAEEHVAGFPGVSGFELRADSRRFFAARRKAPPDCA